MNGFPAAPQPRGPRPLIFHVRSSLGEAWVSLGADAATPSSLITHSPLLTLTLHGPGEQDYGRGRGGEGRRRRIGEEVEYRRGLELGGLVYDWDATFLSIQKIRKYAVDTFVDEPRDPPSPFPPAPPPSKLFPDIYCSFPHRLLTALLFVQRSCNFTNSVAQPE